VTAAPDLRPYFLKLGIFPKQGVLYDHKLASLRIGGAPQEFAAVSLMRKGGLH
jgi:hypothetical protein